MLATEAYVFETMARAGALFRRGDPVGAWRIAAPLVPLIGQHAEARSVVGGLAHLAGDHARAVALLPASFSPVSSIMRGRSLAALDRPAEAGACFRDALALDPKCIEARTELANLQYAQAAAGRAVDVIPRHRPEAPAGLVADGAFDDLRAGRLAEGFGKLITTVYAAPDLQFGGPVLTMPGRSIPRWSGHADPALRLLLIADQGQGDGIQFIRYAAEARRRVGYVTVAAPPSLLRLFAHVEGVDRVVPLHSWMPAAAEAGAYSTLMMLPALIGASYRPGNYIPAAAPQPAGRLRLGLVWAGNPLHSNDAARSLPLSALAPLAEIEGVELHSLQVGSAATEPRPDGMVLIEHPEIADFEDTRRVIEPLDALVSCDTATAHLAAAMGRPVFLLLPHRSDWRWGTDPDASDWYDTVRLFRQQTPGDWSAPVRRVADDLANLARPWTVTVPLFTPAECAAIIGEVQRVGMRAGQLHDGTAEGEIDPTRFAAQWAAIDPQGSLAWAAERVAAAMREADAKVFRSGMTTLAEPGRCIRYAAGDHFDWHRDAGDAPGERRRLSVTVQLSDPTGYGGGDLLVMQPTGDRHVRASRRHGDATIFSALAPHRVAPITRGERHSLVLWGHAAPVVEAAAAELREMVRQRARVAA